jgi:hypothetical protein
MNTLYITSTGTISLNENNKVLPVSSTRNAISRIYSIKEDTNIVWNNGPETKEIKAKPGDIVVDFYEEAFPHKVIVVDCPEWRENIEAWENEEQKIKEKWAECKGECTDDCLKCLGD